ncbi:alpha-(1,3)-fucosyltransferase C-like isoform X2 [Hyposmocoma kahamanoa]|uniref:alpha-(1,3)-fucosyltransferase C-like isoform X2 n=1 Tax=Hyposmocoma kahamanoa TaxID=1477025 RepID=UPI000E6D7141|nr:alpha-(1,3)-fucosyltransferase C-like isoform X2 [Hyposmocoma kahamanoa]
MNKPFNKMGNGEIAFADKFCPYYNCFVTDDVNYFKAETEFDAILFGAEVVRLTNNLLPEQRLPYQKYVFVSMGSAQENTVCTEKFDSYFNWTWTYRLDSEIKSGLVVRDLNETIVAPKNEVHWIPTQRKYTLPRDLSDIIENKTKAAAWIVSDCNTYSYREKIALSLREELKRHLLTLDIYGKCGEFRCESETSCDKTIERDYYFYLAFEDSLCKDYVTTELLHALRYNAVPIVYGGANYTRILPPDSYLDASKMSVPKLAGIMNRLIRVRKDSYAQYFWWKRHYSYYKTSESVDTDEYCELCRLLNSNKFTEKSIYTNFKEWWNHPDEICLSW